MSKTIAQYSTEELVEIMDGLDRDKHPEKYSEVAQTIDDRMGGLAQDDQRNKQTLIAEARQFFESLTPQKAISLILFSLVLSIKPLSSLHNGEFSRGLRDGYTRIDDPTKYWVFTSMWLVLASIPVIILLVAVFYKFKTKVKNRAEQH